MPAATCFATTQRRADLPAASSAAGSTASPRDLRAYRRVNSAGRGRLPVWPVKIRFSLAFMVPRKFPTVEFADWNVTQEKAEYDPALRRLSGRALDPHPRASLDRSGASPCRHRGRAE